MQKHGLILSIAVDANWDKGDKITEGNKTCYGRLWETDLFNSGETLPDGITSTTFYI